MRFSREPTGEVGMIAYFGAAAAIALGAIFGIEAATDIDKHKAESPPIPGAPVCTIYDVENKWGDCTNGHSGGQWIDLANGCVKLTDYNYRGTDEVIACPPKTG